MTTLQMYLLGFLANGAYESIKKWKRPYTPEQALIVIWSNIVFCEIVLCGPGSYQLGISMSISRI